MQVSVHMLVRSDHDQEPNAKMPTAGPVQNHSCPVQPFTVAAQVFGRTARA